MVEAGGRVVRWKHTLYDWLKVNKVELAVMAELLLRGPQTEGDLRARASRMEPLPDLPALQAVLDALEPRGPGRLPLAQGPEAGRDRHPRPLPARGAGEGPPGVRQPARRPTTTTTTGPPAPRRPRHEPRRRPGWAAEVAALEGRGRGAPRHGRGARGRAPRLEIRAGSLTAMSMPTTEPGDAETEPGAGTRPGRGRPAAGWSFVSLIDHDGVEPPARARRPRGPGDLVRRLGPLAPGASGDRRDAAQGRGGRRPRRRPPRARSGSSPAGRSTGSPSGLPDPGRGRRRASSSTAGPTAPALVAELLGRVGPDGRPSRADEATDALVARLPRPGDGLLVAPRPDDGDGPRRRARPREPDPRGPRRGAGLGGGRREHGAEPAPRGVRAADPGARAVLPGRRLPRRPLPDRPGDARRGAGRPARRPRPGHLPRPGAGRSRTRPRSTPTASPGSARRSPRAGPTSPAGPTTRPTSRSCPSARSSGSSATGARSTASTSTAGTSRPLARRRFGLYPMLPQIAKRFGFRFAVHLGFDAGRFPIRPEAKRLWESPDHTSLESPDPPAARRRPAGVGGVCSPGGSALSMKDDHVATLAAGPLAEPGRRLVPRPPPGRRATRPVLARWVTLNDYFHLTDRPYETFSPEPDDYVTPYLAQAVARKDPRPDLAAAPSTRGSAPGSTPSRRLRATAEALGHRRRTLPDGPGLDELETAIETGRLDEAAAALDVREPVWAGAMARGVVGDGDERAARLPRHQPGRRRPPGRRALARRRRRPPPRRAAPRRAVHRGGGLGGRRPARLRLRLGPPRDEPRGRRRAGRRRSRSATRCSATSRSPSRSTRRPAGSAASRRPARTRPGSASSSSIAGLIGPDGKPVASRMRGESFEVEYGGPALAQAVTTGHDPRPRTTAASPPSASASGSGPAARSLELDVTLSDLDPDWLASIADADPWSHYLACRWAWPDPSSMLRRTCLLSPELTEADRPETPDALDISTRRQRTALLFGGLAHHRRHGGRMLDTLLVAGRETGPHFRLGVVARPANTRSTPRPTSSPRPSSSPTEAGPPRDRADGLALPGRQQGRRRDRGRVRRRPARTAAAGAWPSTCSRPPAAPPRCRLRTFRNPDLGPPDRLPGRGDRRPARSTATPSWSTSPRTNWRGSR